MGVASIQLSNIPDIKKSFFSYDIGDEASLFETLNAWGAEEAPGVLKRIFDPETGSIAGTMIVLINGRSVKSEDPKKTMVSPGDVILIAPILVGG